MEIINNLGEGHYLGKTGLIPGGRGGVVVELHEDQITHVYPGDFVQSNGLCGIWEPSNDQVTNDGLVSLGDQGLDVVNNPCGWQNAIEFAVQGTNNYPYDPWFCEVKNPVQGENPPENQDSQCYLNTGDDSDTFDNCLGPECCEKVCRNNDECGGFTIFEFAGTGSPPPPGISTCSFVKDPTCGTYQQNNGFGPTSAGLLLNAQCLRKLPPIDYDDGRIDEEYPEPDYPEWNEFWVHECRPADLSALPKDSHVFERAHPFEHEHKSRGNPHELSHSHRGSTSRVDEEHMKAVSHKAPYTAGIKNIFDLE